MPASALRNVLQYVRRFRGRVFVIALDGKVSAHPNFRNVLLDVAALHSLNIRIVAVHGVSAQIDAWCREHGVDLCDTDGTGPVDDTALEIARLMAARVSQATLEGLFSSNQLRAAIPNAVKAKPVGILGGVDQLHRGRPDQVDADYLLKLLDEEIVPVIPPVAPDRAGQIYRMNFSELAVAVAGALQATKLIFLTDRPGVEVNGTLTRHISVGEMAEQLERQGAGLPPAIQDKVRACLEACRAGVKRAHIIDGTAGECLLSEVFSRDGVGTMIHANEYESIRPAEPKDVPLIWSLLQPSLEKAALAERSAEDIAADIGNYYVFDTDGTVLGCVALYLFEDEAKAELASLHVSPVVQNQGVGARLVKYVETIAREAGIRWLFCLSTQSFSYFQQQLGFSENRAEFLPEVRRIKYLESARNSRILSKELV